jgi:diamine N-acetyltransferase
MGLNRIFAHILEDNIASLSLFKKCGFKVEGQMRHHAFKEGRFKDVTIVGLCAQDHLKDQDQQ